MPVNAIEVKIYGKGFGNAGNAIHLHPLDATSSLCDPGRCLVQMVHTETRTDDDDEDRVITYGCEVSIEELRNAINLIEMSEFGSCKEESCQACGHS
jgi:hypothetical protein